MLIVAQKVVQAEVILERYSMGLFRSFSGKEI
jgi:hypothetical protein